MPKGTGSNTASGGGGERARAEPFRDPVEKASIGPSVREELRYTLGNIKESRPLNSYESEALDAVREQSGRTLSLSPQAWRVIADDLDNTLDKFRGGMTDAAASKRSITNALRKARKAAAKATRS
jgi:hypothetical protein